MGFTTKQTRTKEVTAPPRLTDGSSSSINSENPVPWDVPRPAPASPKSTYPPIVAPAMQFLADLKAARKYCPQLMEFLGDVKGVGKYRQLLMLLQDFTEYGLHPGLISSAETVFEAHPDLLLAFISLLPVDSQGTVPAGAKEY